MLEPLNNGKKPAPVEEGLILDISSRSGTIKDVVGRVVSNTGVTRSTAVMRKGNPSMYFNGTQFLSIPNGDGSLWLPGAFCIDFWFYLISKTSKFPQFFGNYSGWPDNNGFQLFAGHDSSGPTTFSAAIAGEFPRLNGTATIAYGGWHHYATERTATGVITNYIDGVANGTFSTTAPLHGSKTRITIGCPSDDTGNGGMNDYLDRFRIKSSARYNGSFTPPDF